MLSRPPDRVHGAAMPAWWAAVLAGTIVLVALVLLARGSNIAAAAIVKPRRVPDGAVRQIHVTVDRAGAQLAGWLLVPAGGGRHPGVLLQHGAGAGTVVGLRPFGLA